TYDAPQKGLLWGWEVAGYLWTKSIAGGILFFPLLLNLAGWLPLTRAAEMAMAVLGLAFLALTGLLLVKDLDQPRRFVYVLLRPQWRSWLARGAYIITAFGAATTLWLALLLLRLEVGAALRVLLILLGAAAAVYTAFLFAQAKGRDLWQSPLLPLHVLVHGALTGGAALLLLASFTDLGDARGLAQGLLAALILNLGLLLVEFTLPHGSHDSHAALRILCRGALRMPFWAAVLLGNVVPVGLLLTQRSWGNPAAALLMLGFAVVHDHVWVKAPQLVPLR
ncbi:MAG TPA: NrfD/PsrC family molybdoenzyme membrane anchor subunit, partial [bacterium]|nr:NrfD/PsrC family molybdoenzyme membrane anchor subunit [bacterium]